MGSKVWIDSGSSFGGEYLLVASCHPSASSLVISHVVFSRLQASLILPEGVWKKDERNIRRADHKRLMMLQIVKQSTPSDLISKDKDEVGTRSFCSAPFFRLMT